MKRFIAMVVALVLAAGLLTYGCTGNIMGHEFNRLFPEEPVSRGSEGKPLSGKTVVCMGDSIIGMNRTGTSVTAYLARQTGATVYNVGFGGTRMSVHPQEGRGAFSLYMLADAIVSRDWSRQEREAPLGSRYYPAQLQTLRQIDFSETDILILHYGTNDFTADPGIQPDDPDAPMDWHTTAGALRCSIRLLREAYPDLRIYVSLPLYRYWPKEKEYAESCRNVLGRTLPEYGQAIALAAEEWDVAVIDGYHDMGMDRGNASKLTLDGVHLSRAGRRQFARLLGQHMISEQPSQTE